MLKLDTDTAIAILQANVKRAKKKNVSTVLLAKACRYLVDEFQDVNKVSKLVNLSNEMIREFCLIDSLPNTVKQIIDKNKIGIDVARRISSIKDETRQIQASNAIINLTSHDARALLDFIIKNKDVSVKKSKSTVLDTKTKVDESNVLVFALNKEEFAILSNHAKKNKMTPGRYAKQLLLQQILAKRKVLKNA